MGPCGDGGKEGVRHSKASLICCDGKKQGEEFLRHLSNGALRVLFVIVKRKCACSILTEGSDMCRVGGQGIRGYPDLTTTAIRYVGYSMLE
jgi:hypothetical protein